MTSLHFQNYFKIAIHEMRSGWCSIWFSILVHSFKLGRFFVFRSRHVGACWHPFYVYIYYIIYIIYYIYILYIIYIYYIIYYIILLHTPRVAPPDSMRSGEVDSHGSAFLLSHDRSVHITHGEWNFGCQVQTQTYTLETVNLFAWSQVI